MSMESAQAEFDRAALALHREQLIAELSRRPGLAYGALTDDPCGPYLVTYNGTVIGEVCSATPGAVHDWHASQGSTTQGPFLTARAAAASLLPDSNSG